MYICVPREVKHAFLYTSIGTKPIGKEKIMFIGIL